MSIANWVSSDNWCHNYILSNNIYGLLLWGINLFFMFLLNFDWLDYCFWKYSSTGDCLKYSFKHALSVLLVKNSAKSIYSYSDKIMLFSFYTFYITNNALNPMFNEFYIMCPLTSISYYRAKYCEVFRWGNVNCERKDVT